MPWSVLALANAGVDILVVDTANGVLGLALAMIKRIKADSGFSGVDVIGGNASDGRGRWRTR